VGVQNLAISVRDKTDPEVLVLWLQFDAILRRQTFVDVHIAPKPVFQVQVDRRRGDAWEKMSTSSWYDTGDIKYQDCRPFGPGSTFEFPEVKADVILRKNDESSHSRLTVRIHLQSVCKQGNKTFIQPLVTEPVEVVVPRW
jgi:hypothetical protein